MYGSINKSDWLSAYLASEISLIKRVCWLQSENAGYGVIVFSLGPDKKNDNREHLSMGHACNLCICHLVPRVNQHFNFAILICDGHFSNENSASRKYCDCRD